MGPRDGRDHRVGDAVVLRRLRPHPYHRRRDRALVPVRATTRPTCGRCCAAAPRMATSRTAGAPRCGTSRPGTASTPRASLRPCARWGLSVADVLVRFFAAAAEAAGRDEQTLTAATVGDLRADLEKRYGDAMVRVLRTARSWSTVSCPVIPTAHLARVWTCCRRSPAARARPTPSHRRSDAAASRSAPPL